MSVIGGNPLEAGPLERGSTVVYTLRISVFISQMKGYKLSKDVVMNS